MFDSTKIVIDQRVPRNSTQKIEIKDEGAILNAKAKLKEIEAEENKKREIEQQKRDEEKERMEGYRIEFDYYQFILKDILNIKTECWYALSDKNRDKNKIIYNNGNNEILLELSEKYVRTGNCDVSYTRGFYYETAKIYNLKISFFTDEKLVKFMETDEQQLNIGVFNDNRDNFCFDYYNVKHYYTEKQQNFIRLSNMIKRYYDEALENLRFYKNNIKDYLSRIINPDNLTKI